MPSCSRTLKHLTLNRIGMAACTAHTHEQTQPCLTFYSTEDRGEKKQNSSPPPLPTKHTHAICSQEFAAKFIRAAVSPTLLFFSHNYCGINLSMGLSGKRERGIVQISNTLTHNVHAHTQVLMLAHRQTDNSVFFNSLLCTHALKTIHNIKCFKKYRLKKKRKKKKRKK